MDHLRADAERNRQRIVDAAREVFAEDGLGASMRHVAARAGVGEPTLRRRFGSKSALVAEVFDDKIAAYAQAAETAQRDPDAWRGFTTLVREMAEMQLADRGFAELLTMTFPDSMRVEQHRRRAYEALGRLIARAQKAGSLRNDFSPEDLPMLLLAHAGVAAAGGAVAAAFSGRLLAYLLEAFAAPGARPLPAAPSAAATYRALLGLQRNAG
ncbi:helix-turn-helix domain-containing protein [Actinoplanes sp. NPDC051411]|uniref:TetR/AcrR family transcriptional regulator n=1 Tax=Actinoplanes sp. NPDC051411 TaxID=3155522 RepID=UPI00344484F2